ncbi:MAG: phosphoadenylyl-sulfate reductase [Flavobacteriales bacterium]
MTEHISRLEAELREVAERTLGAAVFTTSLGKEDQVLTALIANSGARIRIATLDTGRHFSEYYELLERTQNKYGIRIEVAFPEASDVNSYVTSHGINGFYNSVDARKACCAARKVLPLRKVLSGAALWVTGLRAAQSENRSGMAKHEFDDGFGIAKYNPLIDWSDADIDATIDALNIPINPLHRKGFESIGCAPCTRAIEPGEHPRAGRWWWESSKKECGLHTTQP